MNKISCLGRTFIVVVVAVVLAVSALAQANAVSKAVGPKVSQLDLNGLKKVIIPNGRPMLINFWATWCDPCREEFPDLVKLHVANRASVDFITISLDDLADINGDVPKFLGQMRSEMPAFLLKVPDEGEAVRLVSENWGGNLPLTVVLDPNGRTVYQRNGKFKPDAVQAVLDSQISLASAPIFVIHDFVKIKDGHTDEAVFFYENNWKAYREAAKKRGFIDSFEIVKADASSDGSWDLMLITRFRGEQQLANVEKAFEPIIKELRPDGPKLLNMLKPDEFRQNVFAYKGPQIPIVN